MNMAKSVMITITIMRSMSIITTMTTKSMSIIMNMTMKSMSIIMIMTAVDMITIITMQMKYLQAGVRKLTEEGIRAILDTLSKEDSDEYGIILRAKGIVPDENGKWIHFDLVPGEDEVRYGSAEYTGRICVIGSKLNEDKLAELFGL